MEKDSGLYAAFAAKDARFDGRFFVGISSTGIYCRPVCKAKQPKEQNCSFYATAAEAELAGYRPCLLCRPELAPGSSSLEVSATLAHRDAALIEEQCGAEQSLRELAQRLGCTDRHLRRVFIAEFHVTPVQYLQTCRLLLAKGLLTDTELSVLDVAMAAGFGSLRRLNDLFKKRYRLSPTDLRSRRPQSEGQGGCVTLPLGYRPPYRWEEMLRFLDARAVPGLEAVIDGEYLRTVRLTKEGAQPVCGWLRVGHSPRDNTLCLSISDSLLPALPQVLAGVRRLFDLCCDPHTVFEALSPMDEISPGVNALGTRLPGSFDSFEMAVRAVLGQQISVKAARTLAGRLTAACGTPLDTGIRELTHTFPLPEDILAIEGPVEQRLGPLGIISARARTIRTLAEALADGCLDFSPGADPRAQIDQLLRIPGIGPWTAQYIAMRAMGCPDAFLETDAGIKKALAGYSPDKMLGIAEAWRPWRSYAVINLWNSL